jgi:hypothetical protein
MRFSETGQISFNIQDVLRTSIDSLSLINVFYLESEAIVSFIQIVWSHFARTGQRNFIRVGQVT